MITAAVGRLYVVQLLDSYVWIKFMVPKLFMDNIVVTNCSETYADAGIQLIFISLVSQLLFDRLIQITGPMKEDNSNSW